MDCTYCYVPGRKDNMIMEDEVLRVLIAKVLRCSLVQKQIEFLWHAGEPLAAGMDFYMRALQHINCYNHRRLGVRNTIQTNGTLLDDRWAHFLAEHDFGVGLSIDGPAELHDRCRRRWDGRGTHAAAMRALDALRRAGIEPGVICVLRRDSLDYPDEIFRFFRDAGFKWLGFNVEEVENAHRRSSLTEGAHVAAPQTAAAYRLFMERLFSLWCASDRRLRIREFDDVLGVLLTKQKDPGYFRQPDESRAHRIITVLKTGSLTSFAPELAGAANKEFDDFIIGNIVRDEIEDAFCSPVFKKLAAAVQEGTFACARKCKHFDFCGGGFVSNKYFENGSFVSTETTACRLHRKVLTEVVLDGLVAYSCQTAAES